MNFASGAKLELTGETIQLANTQEHWSMRAGRLSVNLIWTITLTIRVGWKEWEWKPFPADIG